MRKNSPAQGALNGERNLTLRWAERLKQRRSLIQIRAISKGQADGPRTALRLLGSFVLLLTITLALVALRFALFMTQGELHL